MNYKALALAAVPFLTNCAKVTVEGQDEPCTITEDLRDFSHTAAMSAVNLQDFIATGTPQETAGGTVFLKQFDNGNSGVAYCFFNPGEEGGNPDAAYQGCSYTIYDQNNNMVAYSDLTAHYRDGRTVASRDEFEPDTITSDGANSATLGASVISQVSFDGESQEAFLRLALEDVQGGLPGKFSPDEEWDHVSSVCFPSAETMVVDYNNFLGALVDYSEKKAK